MKLSSIMEANVSVVEKPEKNSSQLTTNITMEMLKEENINHKHGNLYAKEACPMITKSYATTATMQEQIMANAHIKLEIKIDLLTAGVPCQPASVAGKRGGKTDARWLWPETLEVIRRIKPTWCLLENVSGILSLEGGMEFENVCTALEKCGYEVQTFIIPACSLNAPHRRNRVWIVANSKCSRFNGKEISICWEKQRQIPLPTWPNSNAKNARRRKQGQCGLTNEMPTQRNSQERPTGSLGRPNSNAPDSSSTREESISQQRQGGSIESADSNPSNSTKQGLERAIGQVKQGNRGRFTSQDRGQNWQENWYEVATRFCRVDDGVSDRVHRLKALGNAIVPQIAYEILKNIAWIENNRVA
jgi:DNA (cytosine-5)-methyltransferase 1